MNLNQLRAFYAVAVGGGFSVAAKRISVSQPALSAQVKTLERHYGVLLFERRARGVHLTASGRALLPLAEQLFGLETRAEALLGRKEPQGGVLRVGADNPQRLMPLLAALRKAVPGLAVQASFANSEGVLAMLHEAKVDAAVLSGAHDERTLHVLELGEAPLLLVANRRRARASLRSVHGQPMIRREPGSRTQAEFDAACRRHRVQPVYVLEVDSREALREAIAVGLGAGVITEGELGDDPRLHGARLSDVRLYQRSSLVCLSSRSSAPAVAALFAAARP